MSAIDADVSGAAAEEGSRCERWGRGGGCSRWRRGGLGLRFERWRRGGLGLLVLLLVLLGLLHSPKAGVQWGQGW